MSNNTDLANIFHTMATILEIKGESGFKVNANTKVARTLEDLVEDIATVKDLTTITGIGKSSATKIQHFLKDGTIPEFEILRFNTLRLIRRFTRSRTWSQKSSPTMARS